MSVARDVLISNIPMVNKDYKSTCREFCNELFKYVVYLPPEDHWMADIYCINVPKCMHQNSITIQMFLTLRDPSKCEKFVANLRGNFGYRVSGVWYSIGLDASGNEPDPSKNQQHHTYNEEEIRSRLGQIVYFIFWIL